MSWNYRVIKFCRLGLEEYFEIHEVHYDKDDKPTSYTESASDIVSESLEGIQWHLDRMREALDKPVLTPEDFPEPKDSP